jgi:Ca-activated chloride channel family protein
MKKSILRYAALSLTLPFIAATFASCGEYDGSSGNYQRSEYPHTYYEDTNTAESYYPEYSPDTEEYKAVKESGFKDPKAEPLSTFSADVDTASYTNARRMLNAHQTVAPDSVRIEEYINYFDYKYADPEDGKVFGEYVELTDCPWNTDTKLMMIGIQGKRIAQEELPPSNLVFLIDSSGSMASYNKLPLVQQAFSMLAENLTENDRISIVTYAGSSKTVLSGTSGDDLDEITEALSSIVASGGTNGEGGIETAYKLAEEYFIEGGNNRVILATDGDLNIGKCSEDELTELIEEKRESGVYLSVLGFGTGNIKDNKMEALADNGNGNYSYIDSVEEAWRVLVEEMGGTLFTIAKDVKVQVEFNQATVAGYRLVGYDNRLMAAEDFYDDSKDAGEVGAGHAVTALYEVELVQGSETAGGTYHDIPLEFAEEHTTEPVTEAGRSELIKLSVAYKDIDTDEETYSSELYGMEKYDAVPTQGIQLAGAAAEFAMLLKNSEFKGDSSFEYIISTAKQISGGNEKIDELRELAEKASSLYS